MLVATAADTATPTAQGAPHVCVTWETGGDCDPQHGIAETMCHRTILKLSCAIQLDATSARDKPAAVKS